MPPRLISTIWKDTAKGQQLRTPEELEIRYIKDTNNFAKHNSRIPKNISNMLRIMTYNVHYWAKVGERNMTANNAYQDIISVIIKTKPDVLLLQEVLFKDKQDKKNKLKDFNNLGYKWHVFGETAPKLNVMFGNMILSKYKLDSNKAVLYSVPDKNKQEQRGYVHAKIYTKGNRISIYNTHLDVFDKTGVTRVKEITELLNAIKLDNTENLLIAADFNNVRQKDYNYKINNNLVWDLYVNREIIRKPHIKINTITKAIDLVEQEFTDSFTKTNTLSPTFTSWTGNVIDFIFLKNTWDIPIIGTYEYYDSSSDHIPIIMDIKPGKICTTGKIKYYPIKSNCDAQTWLAQTRVGEHIHAGEMWKACCQENCNFVIKYQNITNPYEENKIHNEIRTQYELAMLGLTPGITSAWACSKGIAFVMPALKLTVRRLIIDSDDSSSVRNILSKVFGMVTKLHAHGYYHGNLHMNNIMIDSKNKYYFIEVATSNKFSDKYEEKIRQISKDYQSIGMDIHNLADNLKKEQEKWKKALLSSIVEGIVSFYEEILT